MNREDKYNLVREKILNWYKENKRDYPWRNSKSLYQILVTEILLQKTIAVNVNNIYNDFFTKYSDFNAIYYTEITSIQSDIKGLGLSNKRAQILWDLSTMIIEEYNGELPQNTEILKNVKGIADYVSNAFACFGLNQRTFFIDEKVKVESIYSELDKLLPKTDFKHMYWAILDFGNMICGKNKPKCELCPISDTCCFFLDQSKNDLNFSKIKKKSI